MTIYLQKFPFIASFDWRTDYKERITLEASKRPTIESSHPWYSVLGIYHHYSAEVRPAFSNQRPVFRSHDQY